jgi:hypothetical protein
MRKAQLQSRKLVSYRASMSRKPHKVSVYVARVFELELSDCLAELGIEKFPAKQAIFVQMPRGAAP